MAEKKKGAAEIDVFEAYEAKHKKAKAKKSAAAKKSASARGKSSAKSRKKKKNNRSAWWAWPVTIVMIVILAGLSVTAMSEKKQYDQFVLMREAVDMPGFYPGISVNGQDVTGRAKNDVLSELAAQDQAIRAGLNVSVACNGRTWQITAGDLDYASDYEDVVRAAWQVGHEGSVSERYRAIRQVRQNGANFAVSQGYDTARLRAVTDDIASELSVPAQDAQIIAFDTDTLEFSYATEKTGTYVDADQLYQDTLAALQSGGGQVVTVNQQIVQPTVSVSDISSRMGLMASARTFVEGDRNRRSNISLALSILNGMRIEPGDLFSFNGTIGERTASAGFKMAGAFKDDLVTEEYGGGICQVSTTLFNAVAKSDLELISRSPHSRPVSYVDKGKDAAVSWPNQDFRFLNDTEYPVYIVTEYNTETRWITIYLYGEKLENGVYITIEAQVVEEFEPGEDIYIYTKDLPTGQKKLIDPARYGYYCESYKVYHSADGTEISREPYCRSSYAASGAKYSVGQ